MTRAEFLRELERLLADLSAEEREEALQYYNDYFDDAGPENELKVLVELGSPYEVAKSIKAGSAENAAGSENTDNALHTDIAQNTNDAQNADNAQNTGSTQNTFTGQTPYYEQPAKEKEKISAGTWALIILGIIFASPFLIAGFAVLGGLIIAVVSILFAILAVFAGACFGFIVTGFSLIVAGFATIILPYVGITLMGFGLVSLAIGLLMLMLMVWMASKVIPSCLRGIGHLLRKIFKKKEKVQ